MKIGWSAQAEKDLDAIHSYIARDSAYYAELQIKKIIVRVMQFASRPINGHPVHEVPDSDLREIHAGSYRIIYLNTEDQFTVVTVVHMKQRLSRKRLSGA